jgi:hypothetical protein
VVAALWKFLFDRAHLSKPSFPPTRCGLVPSSVAV